MPGMKIKGDRHWVALLVALLVHLGIVLMLYHLYLERVRPLPEVTEIEIIPMEAHAEGQGAGDVSDPGSAEGEKPLPREQREAKPLPEKQPAPVSPPRAEKPEPKVVPAKPSVPVAQTQTHEESIRAAEATKKRKEAERLAEAERRKQYEAEQARLAAERERREEEARQAEASRRANAKVASAFASKGSGGGGSADASGDERGGKEGGTGASVGAGSHSLAGRSIVSNGGRLSMPTIKKAIRGRINVRIVVDDAGKVTQAEVSLSGTNIADAAARSAAIAAARQTVFNPQPGAPEQKGIITYNFEIQ